MKMELSFVCRGSCECPPEEGLWRF
jgi:hypothetical protein